MRQGLRERGSPPAPIPGGHATRPDFSTAPKPVTRPGSVQPLRVDAKARSGFPLFRIPCTGRRPRYRLGQEPDVIGYPILNAQVEP